MTHEKFYPRLRKCGTSHIITIPVNVMSTLGLSEGDTLKVWIAKDVPDKIIESIPIEPIKLIEPIDPNE